MMVLQFEWYFKAKTCYIYKNFFLCVNQAFTLQFNDIFVYYVQMNQSVTIWSVVARWIPYRVRSVNWLDWLWRLVSQFVCFNLVRIFEFFLQFANLFSPQMGNGWHHLLRLSNLLIINQTIEQLAYENKHFFKQPETKKKNLWKCQQNPSSSRWNGFQSKKWKWDKNAINLRYLYPYYSYL